jgi:site-specific recombinase XerD
MNQITIAAPTGVVLAEADAAAARTFAELEKATSTRRSYRTAFRIFADWCHARGLVPVPASPDTVAAFLAAEATAAAKASTIAHRAAAIRYAHRLAGHETPTTAETVRAVMRGIRRTIGTAPERKAPATADVIGEMLRLCPPTLAGQRDRALLALGFAGAFRRSELVALSVADLVEMPDGFRVLIRHSKTDQEGAGQEIAIPRGYRLRPVEAVQTWLEAAAITEGPVFRAVLKGGRLQTAALTPHSVAVIVKSYAERAGLDPAAYAGHSLRAGFITSAAEAGASVLRIADQSRHQSLDTLRGYVRRADLFKDHAGASFL